MNKLNFVVITNLDTEEVKDYIIRISELNDQAEKGEDFNQTELDNLAYQYAKEIKKIFSNFNLNVDIYAATTNKFKYPLVEFTYSYLSHQSEDEAILDLENKLKFISFVQDYDLAI